MGKLKVKQIAGAAASGANADITSLAGLTTALSVAQGGLGNTTGDASGLSVTENSAANSGTLARALAFKAGVDGSGANGTIKSLTGLTSLTCSGAASFGGAFVVTGAKAAFGSSLYPTGPGALGLYSGTGYVLTNTVGAKSALFGLAAQDSLHWVNSYQPGIDAQGASTLYVISPNGTYGIASAIRSSDNASASAQNVITDNATCVADSPTVAHRTWCRYEHGIIPASSVLAQHINDESSVLNLAPAVATDPYLVNPVGSSMNLRLDSGTGDGTGNAVSAALSILSNGAKYYAGVQFGASTFDTSLTGGIGHAVQMPVNTALTWQHATGLANVDWRLYAGGSTSAAGPFQIEGAGSVQIGPSGGGKLTAIGGSSPSISTTAGDLTLGSATGNLNAPTINSPAIVTTGSITGVTLSGIGIYGGIASGAYSFPPLAFSAPPSGATATGQVTQMSVLSIPSKGSGGSGYSVNDVLTFVGGTFTTAATLKVTAVDGSGAITNWSRLNDGNLNDGYYTAAPVSPVSVTGGTGTGATFTNIGWRPTQVSFTGGSGYVSAPTVTVNGTTSAAAGNQSSTVTATVSNSWSATAASGKIVLDNNGTTIGTTSAPVIVPGSFSGSGSASFASTLAVTGLASLAGNLSLTGASTNTIYFGTSGYAAPGTAAGTKISLYGTAGSPAISDYAIGVNANDLWLNAPSTGAVTCKLAGTITASFGSTIVLSKPVRFTSGTVAAAGTTQATATVLVSDISVVTSGTGGVLLAALVGQRQEVLNTTGSAISVYPASGAQIGSAAANAAVSLAAGAHATFVFTSATQCWQMP